MMRRSFKQTISWATTFKVAPVDNAPMDAHEFQQLCRAIKLNDSLAAAKAFGLSWRTCQRYHYGSMPIPGPVARLLRLAAKYHVTPRELAGPEPKNTRQKRNVAI